MSWPTSRASSRAATGTCRTPRTSSSSFTTPDGRGAGCGASAPAITSARAVAHRARRREDQAAGGVEHRLHRRRARRARAATACALHVSPSSSRKGSRRRTDREFSATRRRATRRMGIGRTADSRRSMPSLIVHAASDGRARGRVPRAARAPRTTTAGGVVELPGSMQSGYRPDGRSRAVRVSRRHRAAVDRRHHRRRRAHRRVHPRVPEPLPDHPADAGRARRARRRRRPASAGQPLSRVTAAARSRLERLLRRVPEAAAGRRGVLAVHETRSRSNARARTTPAT